MSETTDAGPFRLYDTDGETIAELTTDGSTLKPFINAVRQVVDECRIHFTDDGLRATAVDASNVFMINAALPADAFEAYDLPDGEDAIGVDVASLRHAIRRARMGSDDTLDIRVAERRLYASVARGYDDTNVVTDDYIDLIDPDSIRQEPNMPDLDMVELDVSRPAFVDATEHIDAPFSNHIKYDLVDGDLVVTTNGDTASSKARVEHAAAANADGYGMYSSDYVSDNLAVVRKAKADDLSVHLGEALPILFDFTRTNDEGETLLRGQTMLAPRVKSDDDIGGRE